MCVPVLLTCQLGGHHSAALAFNVIQGAFSENMQNAQARGGEGGLLPLLLSGKGSG